MSAWTYEEIVDLLMAKLRAEQALPPCAEPTPWEAFVQLSEVIHASFSVPHTTVTPMMRRLLFGLACAARPTTVVGVGTYVGYAFSWLLGRRTDDDGAGASHVQAATGFDISADANAMARRNCAVLGHQDRLTFVDSDGAPGVSSSREAIDLLFLDLDDPHRRKAPYRDVLEAALPRLRPGTLVLAHDPCVPVFRNDFVEYDRFIRQSERFHYTCVLPVDPCGLSLAAVR